MSAIQLGDVVTIKRLQSTRPDQPRVGDAGVVTGIKSRSPYHTTYFVDFYRTGHKDYPVMGDNLVKVQP